MTAPKSTPNQKPRSYQQHGLTTLRRALALIQDFDAWLEGFGPAGEPLRALRREMVKQQGGEAVISAAEKIAIDSTLRTYLFLFLVDDFLLMEGSPINKRDRKLFTLAAERGPIYEAVMKSGEILNTLRKNRPKKDPVLLSDYVKSKAHPLPLTPTEEEKSC